MQRFTFIALFDVSRWLCEHFDKAVNQARKDRTYSQTADWVRIGADSYNANLESYEPRNHMNLESRAKQMSDGGAVAIKLLNCGDGAWRAPGARTSTELLASVCHRGRWVRACSGELCSRG